MTNEISVGSLSNHAIIAEVVRLAGAERRATAHLIAALAEFDARRLYLGEGCSSLFTYCTSVLHLSEHAAYSRIEAARATRRFPIILQMLEAGDVTLTTVRLLSRLLTPENHLEVLSLAVHKSKREAEELVAYLRPRPDAPATIRKLPVRAIQEQPIVSMPLAPAASLPAPDSCQRHSTVHPPVVSRPVVAPLAPDRYKVAFTVNRETYDKLRRVQDLMRHSVPNGDLALVFDRALTALLADLEKTRIASVARPSPQRPSAPGTRHVPAAVRRAVWKRDKGQCTFSGTRGRCAETGCLEFHHLRPFASGGGADENNIELRCRAHNQYEATLFFGEPLIARERPGVSYGLTSS